MKYIVTDPCYIIRDDNVWKEFCKKSNEFIGPYVTPEAVKVLREYIGLSTDDLIEVEETGYGDWCNSIKSLSDKVNIIRKGFYADAGLVCVVPLTDDLKDVNGAIFEVPDNAKITVDLDTKNKYWTMIYVYMDNNLVVVSEQNEEEDVWIFWNVI